MSMRHARIVSFPFCIELARRAAPGLLFALAACARHAVTLPQGVAPRGQVVLLRGLANVFSTGMDSLANRLGSAGYQAEVCNHLDWEAELRRLVAQTRNGGARRPLAVVGHSLGADDAVRLAGTAGGEGLSLDLLVTFDPVNIELVPPGPRHVMNFYLSRGLWGRPLRPAPGFLGTIENIDCGSEALTHFDIDKSEALHVRVLAALEQQQTLYNPPPQRYWSAMPTKS